MISEIPYFVKASHIGHLKFWLIYGFIYYNVLHK